VPCASYSGTTNRVQCTTDNAAITQATINSRNAEGREVGAMARGSPAKAVRALGPPTAAMRQIGTPASAVARKRWDGERRVAHAGVAV